MNFSDRVILVDGLDGDMLEQEITKLGTCTRYEVTEGAGGVAAVDLDILGIHARKHFQIERVKGQPRLTSKDLDGVSRILYGNNDRLITLVR